MRIGITALFRFKPSGVANYICNLVYHLSLIDDENEYVVFTNPENLTYFPIEKANFKIEKCELASESPIYRRIWEQVALPRLVRRNNLDLLHCPMNVSPGRKVCSTVVTFIDTQYFQIRSTSIGCAVPT